MKIAIVGATGNVGQRLTAEAVQRHHRVTAIARHTDSLTPSDLLVPCQADLQYPSTLGKILRGHDLVISATRFAGNRPELIIDAVRQAGISRLLVVGGAGSLEVAPGKMLVDTPAFPEAYKEEALAGVVFLQALRSTTDLDWTFLSPSALFEPGQRTGTFRLGKDTLLADKDGSSRISMEDFAIAMMDEAENPAHPRQRFTVGY